MELRRRDKLIERLMDGGKLYVCGDNAFLCGHTKRHPVHVLNLASIIEDLALTYDGMTNDGWQVYEMGETPVTLTKWHMDRMRRCVLDGESVADVAERFHISYKQAQQCIGLDVAVVDLQREAEECEEFARPWLEKAEDLRAKASKLMEQMG